MPLNDFKCGCGCTKMVNINSRGILNKFVRYHHLHTEEARRSLSERSIGNTYSTGTVFSRKVRRRWSVVRTGKVASLETRQRMSVSRLGSRHTLEVRAKIGKGGDLHWNWQGGVSHDPYPKEFNRYLRRSIRERDGHQCQNPECFFLGERLDVHHIDYNKKNSLRSNLITLCRSCHTKSNGARVYWKLYYSEIQIQRGV